MNSASSQQSQVVNSGNISYRPAMSADVEAIVTLVNSAYRGPSSRAGWTTEADLLDGQRTDAEEISRLLGMDNSATLLCLCGDEIIGSVHLEKVDSTTAYLGMLVIKPTLQGRGFGGIQIQVITLRHELIAYYQRHGYRRTGEIRPFPIFNPKFGLPKVEGLMFEVMEKSFC